jgi:ubiquinone/menaquinone biosynthesis C-methylase UbiE
MTHFDLLIDLHKNNPRQGPGSDAITQRALKMTSLSAKADLQVADIGCGTGAQTLVLANHLQGRITAIDLFPAFLDKLAQKAREQELAEKIKTLEASMDALPFEPNSLDLIWSEGAVYILGFETGIRYWHQFLKPGGYLAVSEITWLTDNRPKELDDYWKAAYPEIDTAANKIKQLEQDGYNLIDHFFLPPECWINNYYEPLDDTTPAFLERHSNSAAAQAVVAENNEEFALYEKYQDYYSYGFYIAQKV